MMNPSTVHHLGHGLPIISEMLHVQHGHPPLPSSPKHGTVHKDQL